MDFLFIDFDGVICDSVNEAFVSSWYACFRKRKSVSISGKRRFCSYRPYIKAGADFILLQNCVEKKILIQDQAHYNRIYESTPKLLQKRNYRKFYRARTWLLENMRDFWFRQNRLYPGMKQLLAAVSHNKNVFILSTKKSEFISEILTREGVAWSPERILYASSNNKIPIMESFLRSDGDRAVLIDDQSEYFCEHDRIRFYLAAWGYVADPVKAAALADRVLEPEDFERELRGYSEL